MADVKNMFFLRVIAAEKVFYTGYARNLIIETLDGQISFLAHHQEMMAALNPGRAADSGRRGKLDSRHSRLRIHGVRQQPRNRACGNLRAAGRDRPEKSGRGIGTREGADAPEAKPAGVSHDAGGDGKGVVETFSEG